MSQGKRPLWTLASCTLPPLQGQGMCARILATTTSAAFPAEPAGTATPARKAVPSLPSRAFCGQCWRLFLRVRSGALHRVRRVRRRMSLRHLDHARQRGPGTRLKHHTRQQEQSQQDWQETILRKGICHAQCVWRVPFSVRGFCAGKSAQGLWIACDALLQKRKVYCVKAWFRLG